MEAPAAGGVTGLLLAWRGGDRAAPEKLIPLVYAELRRLAHRQMRRERPGHTLQTTALFNETYLRLVDSKRVRWQNRARFFAVCAQSMRRVLVDHARVRVSLKRGGEAVRRRPPRARRSADEARRHRHAEDPGGRTTVFRRVSVEETAEALDVSPDTVMRDWKMAKLWLLREFKREAVAGSG